MLDSVLARDALYLTTPIGLCRFDLDGARPQPVPQVTESVGTATNSLAWLDGRLYPGLGSGFQGKSGLASYDPKAGTTELIASAAATEIRSGLDGGTGYRINAMVSDPKRHCLWLGVAHSTCAGRAVRRRGTRRSQPSVPWSRRRTVSWP